MNKNTNFKQNKAYKMVVVLVVGLFVAVSIALTSFAEQKIEEVNTKVSVNDSGTGSYIYFQQDGTEYMRLTSGKFGIGTSTPERILDIVNSTGDCLRLSRDATYYADLKISSSGYLKLNPSHNRVGIEVNQPLYTLDVNGGIRTNGIFLAKEGVGTGSGSPYTVPSDAFIVLGETGCTRIDLPDTSSADTDGRILVIKRVGTSNINVYGYEYSAGNYDTIDGVNGAKPLNGAYDSIMLQEVNNQWYILSYYT
jgi:hypothetical protein